MSESKPPNNWPAKAENLANTLSNLIVLATMYSGIKSNSTLGPLGVESFYELLQRDTARLRHAIVEAIAAVNSLDGFPLSIGRIQSGIWIGELLEALRRLQSENETLTMLLAVNRKASYEDMTAFAQRRRPILEQIALFKKNLDAIHWPDSEGSMGGARPGDCEHALDYRSVKWHGQTYAFTAAQAAIVKILWNAYERGVREIGGDTLLVEGGLEDTSRIKDLFRGNRAWKVMIVPGSTKGSYRLSDIS